MPLNLPPYYDYRSRADFFRKTMFLPLSGEALGLVGLGAGDRGGWVAFLPVKSATLAAWQKVILFPDSP
jgi:hypothetical protein